MSRIDTGTQYLIRRGPNASRARHRRLLAFVLVALPHLGLIWLATRPDSSHPQPPSGPTVEWVRLNEPEPQATEHHPVIQSLAGFPPEVTAMGPILFTPACPPTPLEKRDAAIIPCFEIAPTYSEPTGLAGFDRLDAFGNLTPGSAHLFAGAPSPAANRIGALDLAQREAAFGRATPEAGPVWSKDDAPPVPVEPWQQVNARFAKAYGEP